MEDGSIQGIVDCSGSDERFGRATGWIEAS
jgi:hypothetical protein